MRLEAYREKRGRTRRKRNGEKRGNPNLIKPKKDHTYSAPSCSYEPTPQESIGDLKPDLKKQSANKPLVLRSFTRHSETDFEDIVQQKHGDFSMPDARGNEGTTCVLRPMKENTSDDTEKSYRNKLWDTTSEYNLILEMNIFMSELNKAVREHSETLYSNIELQISDITQVGCFIRGKISCKNCTYQRTKRVYYAERPRQSSNADSTKMQPGPKMPKGNMRLAYMCQEASIGPTKLRFFLAALGIPVIYAQRLYTLTQMVGELTIKLNEADMEKWIRRVEQVLAARGFTDTKTINIASDALDKGSFMKSSVTPGTGATAGTLLGKEQVTGTQKIIHVHYESKRCPRGTRLQGEGFLPNCGTSEPHTTCLASIPYEKDKSERKMTSLLPKYYHSVTRK